MSSSVTATFVFTDLVGSTATAARLGPAAANELRQKHFGLLRGAVQASGGIEVKNLGDGLMVMYSSPSRALAGAVGMQQAIHHHNRSDGERLGVRIGVSAGEAVEEDGDFFGDPVVEAARLCAAANGGQVLAAEIVRSLVGRNATQSFVEVGPLALKGIPQPVDAVEVLWEPAKVEGSVPLPVRLVGAAADALFGFFGRQPELAVLQEAGKQAHDSRRCQVVFVSGEAGLGKTALAAQGARAAHEQGAVVLFGHADEDLGVAYQPWIEALAALVRDGDVAVIDSLPLAQQAALARLMPTLQAEAATIDDPDTERLLLLEGTAELLAAASKDVSVFLVLDDLHWADAASLQLLRHVTAARAPMDVTLACTYRETDLSRGNPLNKLLADLYREANVTRIGLRGLEDTEVIDLMEAAAGHTLDESGIGLAHALRRETDGNPFFTGEILRHLGETGAIVMGHDGRWTVADALEDLGLPNSVRDVIGQRVERLGEEAVRVLSLASVIGREFDFTTLGTLADTEEEVLLDLLDAAVAAAVLVESTEASRYRFAHALIQHTLYDDLSATRRQRVHQRIAANLEGETTPTDPALLAELARHWIAATRPSDLDKALRYARLAGDAARDALAPDDAIRWYQQALDLLDRQIAPDVRSRAELLIARGTEQLRVGDMEYRATLDEAFEIGEQLGDTRLVVDAALGFARFVGGPVGDADTNRIVAAALQRVGPEPTATRARLLAALAETYDAAAQWRDRRQAALEALDTARLADDNATFVDVIDAVYTEILSPDRLEESIEDFERAVTIADHLGDPIRRTRTRFRAMHGRYSRADLDGVDRIVRDIGLLADTVGLPNIRYEYALTMAGRELRAGNASAAEAACDAVLEYGTAAGAPETLASYGGVLYQTRQHQGRVDEIADLIMQAARDMPSLPALRSTIAWMLCELGRIDEAREHLAAEAANGFEYPYNYLWLVTGVNFIEAAVSTGDEPTTRLLLDRLAPYAHHILCTTPLVSGAVARPLGRAATLLGEYNQADEWFASAHDIHTRLQAPFWLAMGQLDHADLCVTRNGDGDLEHARELIGRAAATAAEYGCAGLTRRADKLLAEM